MKITTAIITFDYHCEFVDFDAVECALSVSSHYRPDYFIIGGDYNDCYSISKYRKNPHKMHNFLDNELQLGRELISDIEVKSRAKHFVFLEGNHEDRITTDIFDNAPHLTNYLNPKQMQGIPNKWEYLPYGKQGHYKLGNLVITHGFNYSKHSAFNYLQNYKCNIMFGHTHRVNTYHEKNYSGETLSAFNVGWLGDPVKAQDYVKDVDKAIQAFAIAEFYKNRFRIQIIRIHNGEAIFNGKIYKGKSR